MIWLFIKKICFRLHLAPVATTQAETPQANNVRYLAKYRYERQLKKASDDRRFAYEEARAECFRRRKLEHEKKLDDEANRGYLYWSLLSPRDK